MFEEILALCEKHRDAFAENARDDFGRSIVEDIYAPLLREISAMIEYSNRVQEHCSRILENLPGKDN